MKYQNELQLIIHSLDGLFFQNFFNDLMKLSRPDFQVVRQKNDGGNDGFIPNTGTYYQVFAPEILAKDNVNKGAFKIINDFENLLRNWSDAVPVEKYIFVFNDKRKGTNKDLHKKIAQINKEYALEATLYDSRDVSRIFNDLSDEHKENLIRQHTYGLNTVPNILTVAAEVEKKLSIPRWDHINENYLIFNCILESDVKELSKLSSYLFSVSLSPFDQTVVDELIKSITNFTTIFHSPLTRSHKGERQWDNSWKGECFPHPKAAFYNEEFEKWKKDVLECTINVCKSLNTFANHVRHNHKQDYLDYRDYTITRRTGDDGQHSTFVP